MSGRANAVPRLERALANHAAATGVGLTIAGHRVTRWASATFVGARHRLEMTVAGGAARAWLADLAEAELTMPGHLVADLTVLDARHDAADTIALVEVLTVEDGG